MLNYDNNNKYRIQKCSAIRQYKTRFSLTKVQVLASASSTNLVRQIKNLPPNFKQITYKRYI